MLYVPAFIESILYNLTALFLKYSFIRKPTYRYVGRGKQEIYIRSVISNSEITLFFKSYESWTVKGGIGSDRNLGEWIRQRMLIMLGRRRNTPGINLCNRCPPRDSIS